MNKDKKTNKKVPVATIKLLPVGYGETASDKSVRLTGRKGKGHYETRITRYRTYWRHGSGVKVISERFESCRVWVREACKRGGRTHD